MEISNVTKRNFYEAKYLTVEKCSRYRVIIRIAYMQFEKMKFWLYKEDFYKIIEEGKYFNDYTIDDLRQDLDVLTGWSNLITIQDTGNVKTLEQFNNRKFRYQISPNTIELERTLIKLEGSNQGNRGSLEIKLIERVLEAIEKIPKLKEKDSKEKYSWWNILSNDFKLLNENYQDYISRFYSPSTEELLKTSEFIIFKENFINYLREFIKGLQINSLEIQKAFEIVENDEVLEIIEDIIVYENSGIGLKQGKEDIEDIREGYFNRYKNLKSWFLGGDGEKPMTELILDNTNIIIKKILRFAIQISEMRSSGGSRREEYRKILDFFYECEDMDKAHEISSIVFGVMNTRHVIAKVNRETESINSGVFEEKPTIVNVNPQNRKFREHTKSEAPVRNENKNKKEIMKAIVEKRKNERVILEKRIRDGKLIFNNLKAVSREERRIFLNWLSKGVNKKTWIKNEYGMEYRAIKKSNEEITFNCIDGNLYMPDYILEFRMVE